MGVIDSQFHNAIDPRNLARSLGGEVSGDQILAPGPGHDGEDRSLSVKVDPSAPGGFIVHSFAEDDWQECRDHVCKLGGLEPFKPSSQGYKHHSAVRGPQGSVEATYDYRDESGLLLYQVVRLKPKSFRQRRPDGNGNWIWKLGDTRRVLYRLPELLRFPDATVFVCEGEKDADRVASLEHCATTVGSGKWTDDCVKALADRHVIILQDNDQPGAKKALDSAQALHSVAKTIRIVLLPDLPAGGDVSDWLDADPERAGKLVDVCFEVQESTPSEADGTDSDEIHIRLAQIARHYGVTFKDLIDGGLHVLCLLGKDATLCAANGKSGKVETTALYKQLYEAAGDIKPKNISVDTAVARLRW